MFKRSLTFVRPHKISPWATHGAQSGLDSNAVKGYFIGQRLFPSRKQQQ